MHCGYLFLVLWAGLTAGRALPINTTDKPDADVQSVIADLQVALNNYGSILNETSYLSNLPVQPCTESPAHLEQSSTLAEHLSRYQVCAEQLGSFNPHINAFCGAVNLNRDLLQHLGSDQTSEVCPTSSTSSASPDFTIVSKSMQCVLCWSQQVAALRR